MKILPLSDLHLEWGMAVPEMTFIEEDRTDTIVVLAGDIHNGLSAIDWIEENLVDKVAAIVYVPGNHEYYGQQFYELDAAIKAKIIARGLEENIFFLNGDTIILGDIQFIGVTLWTDMNKEDPLIMNHSLNNMNDYNLIYNGTLPTIYGSYKHNVIVPYDTIIKHKEHLAFVKEELSKDNDKIKVVVSHHLPSHECIMPWFRDPKRCDAVSLALNHAYASNLDDLLENGEAHLWVHGHSHSAYDKMIGNTVVVSNALGYPGHYVKGFNPDLRINIED